MVSNMTMFVNTTRKVSNYGSILFYSNKTMEQY